MIGGGDDIKRGVAAILIFCTLLSLALSVVADNSTTVVYVTDYGKKYHVSSCGYLYKSKRTVTLRYAVEHNYSPCSRCNPPTPDFSTEKTQEKTAYTETSGSSSSTNQNRTTTANRTLYLKPASSPTIEESANVTKRGTRTDIYLIAVIALQIIFIIILLKRIKNNSSVHTASQSEYGASSFQTEVSKTASNCDTTTDSAEPIVLDADGPPETMQTNPINIRPQPPKYPIYDMIADLEFRDKEYWELREAEQQGKSWMDYVGINPSYPSKLQVDKKDNNAVHDRNSV